MKAMCTPTRTFTITRLMVAITSVCGCEKGKNRNWRYKRHRRNKEILGRDSKTWKE